MHILVGSLAGVRHHVPRQVDSPGERAGAVLDGASAIADRELSTACHMSHCCSPRVPTATTTARASYVDILVGTLAGVCHHVRLQVAWRDECAGAVLVRASAIADREQ